VEDSPTQAELAREFMLKRHQGNNDRASDALFFVGYVPRSVAASKRVLDIVGALTMLAVTAPLLAAATAEACRILRSQIATQSAPEL
jgi:lipopolysaccharide/colanic/teichoic acid biosynthesis glycosyltransferase